MTKKEKVRFDLSEIEEGEKISVIIKLNEDISEGPGRKPVINKLIPGTSARRALARFLITMRTNGLNEAMLLAATETIVARVTKEGVVWLSEQVSVISVERNKRHHIKNRLDI